MRRPPFIALLLTVAGWLFATACTPATLTTGWAALAEPLAPPPSLEQLDYNVYLPADPPADRPLTVLLALHGMASNGPEFCARLRAEAASRGWVLVAPTINYGDWRDPEQVRQDGQILLPGLVDILDSLPARTGLTLRKQVLVYGFSRGAQAAHRFALLYPERTLGVVVLSPATYTLPVTRFQRGGVESPLDFPFGMADAARFSGRPFDPARLRGVGFWIGVGDRDPIPAGATAQWDPYLGPTRVERAESFSRALAALGVASELHVFPGAGHDVTDEMRTGALEFLAGRAG